MKAILTGVALSLLSMPLLLAEEPPVSLIQTKAELERTFKQEDVKLAALVNRLSAKLAPTEGEAFEKAQSAWLGWRETQAAFLAYRYAAKEASSHELLDLSYATVTISMKIELTAKRIKELEGEIASPH